MVYTPGFSARTGLSCTAGATGATQGMRDEQHTRRECRMKVTHVKTRIISTPADSPLVVGIPVGNATREFVTLELGTDAGVEGIGLTFFGGPLTVALRDAVEALGSLVVGADPLQVEAIVAKL